ncbi:MAG: hypothetical protein ABUT39_04840 [Acidobacteriota bacterium]
MTSIEDGHFVFKPQADKPVSLGALRKAVTKAGYAVEGTWIEVTGVLTADGLRVPETGQVFRLEGEERLRVLREQADAGNVSAAGIWKVDGSQEIIVLEEPRPKEGNP